jgi:hypothetical protein
VIQNDERRNRVLKIEFSPLAEMLPNALGSVWVSTNLGLGFLPQFETPPGCPVWQ